MTAPDFPALVAQARARLDEIERVAKAATPGPWRLVHVPADDICYEDTWKVVAPDGEDDITDYVETIEDLPHIASWGSPDVALRVVEWGRGVLERHRRFGIWDECGHGHTEADVRSGVAWDIPGVGYTCEQLYDICSQCCTRGEGEQPAECCDDHPHPCWPCPDVRAVLAFLLPGSVTE